MVQIKFARVSEWRYRCLYVILRLFNGECLYTGQAEILLNVGGNWTFHLLRVETLSAASAKNKVSSTRQPQEVKRKNI